jgi:uncharacterized protein
MIAKQFWLNLPVKDIERSREFFTALGFSFNTKHGNTPHSACLVLGEGKVACMLFEESMFPGFARNGIADTEKGTEVLLSIDAGSKEEVDEFVDKVRAAGGTSDHQPSPMTGYMYGCVFSDLDGHRWNVLYMDYSQIPQ